MHMLRRYRPSFIYRATLVWILIATEPAAIPLRGNQPANRNLVKRTSGASQGAQPRTRTGNMWSLHNMTGELLRLWSNNRMTQTFSSSMLSSLMSASNMSFRSKAYELSEISYTPRLQAYFLMSYAKFATAAGLLASMCEYGYESGTCPVSTRQVAPTRHNF
ncbi:hypothetical protein BD310DRAFT_936127 [Dichomitus squalens]|uniref:Secreted protein n=1 Tax=Dichomitus squalens TaxID=114155 RepID=A0A4Q9PJR3_9APHY|nr:hypothetical protein BD310DRAFT_936127 [Dichomitus squalens]